MFIHLNIHKQIYVGGGMVSLCTLRMYTVYLHFVFFLPLNDRSLRDLSCWDTYVLLPSNGCIMPML